MAYISAVTKTLGAGATEDLGNANSWGLGTPAIEYLIRVGGAGMFLGASGVSATAGYELTPNQEYRFRVATVAQLAANSADYSLHIKNTTGAGVALSYAITPQSAS